MEVRAVLAVALGGAIGAVVRFGVGQFFVQRFGPGFPWGTFFINVTGCFLIGVVAQLVLTRVIAISPNVRLFAATGVLGGYTTFSTYALDALTLGTEGAAALAAAYALGSVVAGIGAAYLGVLSTRLLGSG